MNINPINTYTAVKPVEIAPQKGGGDVIVPPRPKASVLAADTVTISPEAVQIQRGGGDIINNPRPK